MAMVMVFLGYLVVVLTVLSISAIATSTTVEGGGVYCISMVTINSYKKFHWSVLLGGDYCISMVTVNS